MSRFASLMGYIAPGPVAEEAPGRPEFERDDGVLGARPDDPEWRSKAERFVLANTPARHKFCKADGADAIVYFDSRGRAASAAIASIPDDDLVRIVAGFSRRGPGEPNLSKPSTSSADHGYRKPVEEAAGQRGKRFSIHRPASADDHLGQAYNDLLAIKGDMDGMEEVPQQLRSFYKQVEKAMDGVASARKETTQLRGMAKGLA